MKNISLTTLLVLGTFLMQAQKIPIPSSVKEVKAKVDSLLALMTLQEKVGQLVQYNWSWDLSGLASYLDARQKEENLKNGLAGAMLNVLSLKATTEAQKLVAKHFAGYGLAEAGWDYNTVHIGENELHNNVLPPFKAAEKMYSFK